MVDHAALSTTRHRRPKRAAAAMAAAVVPLALALAGCGSSSSAATGTSTVSASQSAGSSKTGASTGSGSSVGKLCDLVPVATVAQVTAQPLTKTEEQDVLPTIRACSYTSTDGTSGVVVSVSSQGKIGYGAELDASASTGAKQISGLGDKAFSNALGVHALFGEVEISATGLASDDASVALIKAVHAKL